MAYRNHKSTFVVPKSPWKVGWCTCMSGIARADWKEKCETPVIFLDIDGVLNDATWAQRIIDSRDPLCPQEIDEKLPLWYHEWCNVDSVCRLREFCDQTGCMLVISSSWRYGNVYDTLENMKKYYGFSKLFPYIVGQTTRMNIGRTNGKSWVRGDEVKMWIDEFKPSWYLIIDDDADFLDYQKPHLVNTSAMDGLVPSKIEEMRIKLKNLHTKAWKDLDHDFSFGPKIRIYNYERKCYE